MEDFGSSGAPASPEQSLSPPGSPYSSDQSCEQKVVWATSPWSDEQYDEAEAENENENDNEDENEDGMGSPAPKFEPAENDLDREGDSELLVLCI